MIAGGRGGSVVGDVGRNDPALGVQLGIRPRRRPGSTNLVTSLAMELGEQGIRVLAIAPGTTLTETVRAAFTDEHVNAIDQSTALKRRVEHDELGRLAVFLASDLARCITGQFILADAGAFLSRTRPPNLRHEETQLGDRPDLTSQPATSS